MPHIFVVDHRFLLFNVQIPITTNCVSQMCTDLGQQSKKKTIQQILLNQQVNNTPWHSIHKNSLSLNSVINWFFILPNKTINFPFQISFIYRFIITIKFSNRKIFVSYRRAHMKFAHKFQEKNVTVDKSKHPFSLHLLLSVAH